MNNENSRKQRKDREKIRLKDGKCKRKGKKELSGKIFH